MLALIEGLGYRPYTCTWELTLRCNLDCGHCGSRAGQARANEMPRERALEVAGDLAAMGCYRLSLSGGEPTMSSYWEDVAGEASRLGVRVNLITNGLGAARQGLAQRAKAAGLVSLGVSLDGLEAEHDRNRGLQGLYGRVMDLMDDCEGVGLPIGVITTITKDNFRDLEAMHELLKDRVYVWQLQIGAKMGNLADHCDRQIDPEDLLQIVPAVAGLVRKDEVRIHVSDNLGYYGPYEQDLRQRRKSPVNCWVGCYAGCRHLGIEADGGVKGCLSIQSTRATEGNLQEQSLSDIWHRDGAFAYNREFSLDDLTGFCRSCVHAEVCRGGCLSMRSCEGGSDNPYCYHRVATLAELKKRKSSRRRAYVPMVVAPAALIAAFGFGCGSMVDAYGLPPADGDGDVDGDVDVDADDDADVSGDYYGMPDPDADVGSDSDADVDMGGDWYGMTDPDADVEDDSDADVDLGGDWYGMP